MTIWEPISGRYARMTRASWRNVRVGQTVRYDGAEWLIVATKCGS